MTGQAVLKRAAELDVLSANLPIDRREQLAALLTDDDVATLKHLAHNGMGDNTMRALASDLAYLETWCLAVTGTPLPLAGVGKTAFEILCPPSVGSRRTRKQSGTRHAGRDSGCAAGQWDAAKRRAVCAKHRSPPADQLVNPDALAWVGRAFSRPSLKSALRLPERANHRPRQRKSKKAVTSEILAKLLDACAGDKLVDLRDRALRLMAFASDGRRRSEVATLMIPPPLSCPACAFAPWPNQDHDVR